MQGLYFITLDFSSRIVLLWRFLYSNTLAKYRNEFENIHQLKELKVYHMKLKNFMKVFMYQR